MPHCHRKRSEVDGMGKRQGDASTDANWFNTMSVGNWVHGLKSDMNGLYWLVGTLVTGEAHESDKHQGLIVGDASSNMVWATQACHTLHDKITPQWANPAPSTSVCMLHVPPRKHHYIHLLSDSSFN